MTIHIQQDSTALVFNVGVPAVHVGHHGAGQICLIVNSRIRAGCSIRNLRHDTGHGGGQHNGRRSNGHLEGDGLRSIVAAGSYGNGDVGFTRGHAGDDALGIHGGNLFVVGFIRESTRRVRPHTGVHGLTHLDSHILRCERGLRSTAGNKVRGLPDRQLQRGGSVSDADARIGNQVAFRISRQNNALALVVEGHLILTLGDLTVAVSAGNAVSDLHALDNHAAAHVGIEVRNQVGQGDFRQRNGAAGSLGVFRADGGDFRQTVVLVALAAYLAGDDIARSKAMTIHIQEDSTALVFDVGVPAVHVGHHCARQIGLIVDSRIRAGGGIRNLRHDTGHGGGQLNNGSRYGHLEGGGPLFIVPTGGHGYGDVGLTFGHAGDDALIIHRGNLGVLRAVAERTRRIRRHFGVHGLAHLDGLVYGRDGGHHGAGRGEVRSLPDGQLQRSGSIGNADARIGNQVAFRIGRKNDTLALVVEGHFVVALGDLTVSVSAGNAVRNLHALDDDAAAHVGIEILDQVGQRDFRERNGAAGGLGEFRADGGNFRQAIVLVALTAYLTGDDIAGGKAMAAHVKEDGSALVFDVGVVAVHIGNDSTGQFGLIVDSRRRVGGSVRNLFGNTGHVGSHGGSGRYGNLEVCGGLGIEIRFLHGDRNGGFTFGHAGDDAQGVHRSDGGILRNVGQFTIRVALYLGLRGASHGHGLVLRGDDSGGGLLGEGDNLVGGFADDGEGSGAIGRGAGVHAEGDLDGVTCLVLGKAGNPLVVVAHAPLLVRSDGDAGRCGTGLHGHIFHFQDFVGGSGLVLIKNEYMAVRGRIVRVTGEFLILALEILQGTVGMILGYIGDDYLAGFVEVHAPNVAFRGRCCSIEGSSETLALIEIATTGLLEGVTTLHGDKLDSFCAVGTGDGAVRFLHNRRFLAPVLKTAVTGCSRPGVGSVQGT